MVEIIKFILFFMLKEAYRTILFNLYIDIKKTIVRLIRRFISSKYKGYRYGF